MTIETYNKLGDRTKYIGGSDMPIILGLSNFKTPYQLWLEKTNRVTIDETETEFQYWGTQLEPVIRQEFIKRHQVEVQEPTTITHPLFDYLKANVDGFIPSKNAVLEIKTTASFNAKEWGDEGTDVIPLYYLVQVAHYCAVTNADYAIIAVLIGGNTYREYKYTRDLELELRLLDEAQKFWHAVTNNIEPEPTNIDDLKLKYPKGSPEKSIKINDEVKVTFNTITETKKKIKELSAIEEKAKFDLIKYMEDSEVLIDDTGKVLASYKSGKRGRTFLTKETI